ncbi:amino acid adenylation domain-containing protein [Leeia sp.]|uniref:amino acid adenylation domain-containing protein n=1 Tax=Leeia sp. TaxID=2884678 RepID=UPI0035AD9D08
MVTPSIRQSLSIEQLRALRRGQSIDVVDRRAPLLASYAQQRVWLSTQLEGSQQAYHMPFAVRLQGQLSVHALQQALHHVIQRHESLRTRFQVSEGQLYQCFDVRYPQPLLQVIPVSAEAHLPEALQQALSEPFELMQGPLLRAQLFRLAEEEHVLLLTLHHIITDGWSLGVLGRELAAGYEALLHGQAPTLTPLAIQYADYAGWQRNQSTSEMFRRQRAFWQQQLHEAPVLLPLPTDHARPAVQEFLGGLQHLKLDEGLSQSIRELAQRTGTTVFMVLMAAWSLLLARLAGQQDVVIGTPVANRRRTELEGLMGFFVNTLAVRLRPGPESSIEQYLQQVRSVALEAQDHQDLPFEQVVEALNPPRNLAHTPVFQVMFAWQNNENELLALQGLHSQTVTLPHAVSKFDLTLSLGEEGGCIVGGMEYATALFTEHSIHEHLGMFQSMLKQMVANPAQALWQLQLLSPESRERQLYHWNPAQISEPQGLIQHRFEAQAQAQPDAIAVEYQHQHLSYRELNRRANRLARQLRAHGVGPDQRVALCLERSLDMVVAVLATLKAGGAYVPLDPAYPAERLSHMLQDSEPVVVVSHAAAAAALQGAGQGGSPVLWLEQLGEEDAGDDRNEEVEGLSGRNLAYIIYTSGSTGKPKGVMIEHRNVLRLFDITQADYQFSAQDVWTLFHSFAFDFSVWEIWGALFYGGRLVVVPQETARQPGDFYQLLSERGVTVLNQTPSAFRGLIAAQQHSSQTHQLRHVIFGGEALELSSLQPWYRDPRNARTQLVNMYGITEITVHATYRPLTAADAEHGQTSPVGRGLGDLRCYVLDAYRQPVPVGVVGELYIGGAGVARGYLNRPELNAERFINSPFVAGDRLYKSGDLASYQTDGSLNYLGRNDFQVKIRGFRIELGEIESRLRQYPGIQDGVVWAREDIPGDKRLVAYYTGPEQDAAALRQHLQAELPDYMVPAAYVHLAQLPLTSNGKLDHKALPKPEGDAYGQRQYSAPQGETETKLAAIWAEALSVDRISRHDNFFALGGHSLLAVRVLEHMRRQGLNGDMRALFGTPDLAGLAAALQPAAARWQIPGNRIPADCTHITPDLLPLVNLQQEDIDRIVAVVPGGAANVQDIYPLSPLQEGILFHHMIAEQGDPYLVWVNYAFDSEHSARAYVDAMQTVINRHDILRTAVMWEGLPQPVQIVWRQAQLPLDVLQLSPEDGDIAGQMQQCFEQARMRIDLGQAPLFRLWLSPDPVHQRWLLMVVFHHIIDDNTSIKQFHAEIEACLHGHQAQLEQPLPYRNFIAHIQHHSDPQGDEAWFRQQLGDFSEPTAPFGVLDIQGDGSTSREHQQPLPDGLTQRLRQVAREHGVSTASLCHLAYGMLLAKTTGQSDIVFGTVLFGRLQNLEGADRILGPFINTLPIRLKLDGLDAVAGVRHAQSQLLELLQHEHAPLSLAQRSSALPPRAPLFTALLNYRNRTVLAENLAAPDWERTHQIIASGESVNYPCVIDIDDLGEQLHITAQSSQGLDPVELTSLMQQALQQLVEQLERHSTTPLPALDLLSPESRERQLYHWNPAQISEPQGLIQHRFEAQAQAQPDAIAVEYQHQHLSYRELNRRANRLARQLRAHGVGPDQRVALCLERSLDMVVAVLATLKAGGAYVPLDPAYPAERLSHMLQDSEPVVVVSHAAAAAALQGAGQGGSPVLWLEQLGEEDAGDDRNEEVEGLSGRNLAYIIYTSGSTGKPKGVMIEHRNVRSIVDAWAGCYPLRQGLGVLQMASFAFDVCTADILRALCFGGRLVICPKAALLEPAALYQLMQTHQVGFADFVPAVLSSLVQYLSGRKLTLAPLETLICGSDAWDGLLARAVCQVAPVGMQLVNAFGVTEAAIDSSRLLIQDATDLPDGTLPVGKPFDNTRLYVLDAYRQPVPVGVVGELYIGGAGVARGYLNRPELNAERFIDSPFVAGDRLYKSGDLASYQTDGSLNYLGRNDFQVKIRGFRIELGEIESRLRQYPGIQDGVVWAREDIPGDKRLVAYYTGPEQDAAALRQHLQAELPDYMVPAAYVHLAQLPLTSNGKLDRAALPQPQWDAPAALELELPRGDDEQRMAALWAEVLGRPQIGRHDHFFALGGHSLLAMRLLTRMQQQWQLEVKPALLFKHPVLAEFTAQVMQAGRQSVPELLPVERQALMPPSYAQQRLWFLAQMEQASQAYHMPMALQLNGKLDAAALQKALQTIVARHEALRTTFQSREGEVFQQVSDEVAGFTLEMQDLRGAADVQQALQLSMDEVFSRSFDLQQGPLLRVTLLQLAGERHALLVNMHHIVSDGWSMGVFNHELSTLYRACIEGAPHGLPPLAVQYVDYAGWQRQWMSQHGLEPQWQYWQQQLQDAPALLTLPTDYKRPLEQQYAGAVLPYDIDPTLTRSIKLLAQRHGCTVYMVLLAAWSLLLSRHAGQRDVVIGSPVANRRQQALEALIGFFVNTVALRIRYDGETTVQDLLAHVREVAVGAQDHQDFPFEQLVERLNPTRSLSYSPVFQVLFAWQNTDDGELALPGLEVKSLEMPHHIAKFDLNLALGEQDGVIRGGLEYATALFDAETVQQLLEGLTQVLAEMVRDDQQSVETLPLMPAAVQQAILQRWNQTERPRPFVPVHRLFERQAMATPDAIALTWQDQQLSYRALEQQASLLANRLLAAGVRANVPVGLCMYRSPEVIVSMLAILKAGGACLPLDPAYPQERLAYMLADSKPCLVLTQPELQSRFADVGVPVLLPADEVHQDALPQGASAEVAAEQLIYILYTSGSTGRPKGVGQTQRTLSNLLQWQREALQGPAAVRTLQFASISFDVSFQEIWSTLTTGGTLVMLSEEQRKDLGQLQAFIAEQQVQRAYLPAAVLQQMASLRSGPCAKGSGCDIITAGEALQVTEDLKLLLQEMGSRCLYNQYGPTETHVVTQFALDVTCMASWPAFPPIGRPIDNVRTYVLDAQLQPVPAGVVGELYLAGVAVAKGYLHQDALTAERFLADPFQPQGERMYRSGDLARWNRDGQLEYIGRADQQVKLRGFRIELGEIEQQLLAQPGVGEAAAAVKVGQDGERVLVAYVTGEVELESLQAALKRVLPEHMIPSRWVRLPALPLTQNGKLDRAALPLPDQQRTQQQYVAPRNGVERQLALIWAEILNVPQVGALDNFFALGGHSLLATRLVHQINQRMQAGLRLRTLFKHPVLADLAQAMAEEAGEDPAVTYPVITHDAQARYEPFPMTDIQQAYWVGREESMGLGGVAAHGYGEMRVHGLDEARFALALNRLIARHDMLRTVFRPDGTQCALASVPVYQLTRQDLRGLPPEEVEQRLQLLRERMSHQVMDASQWPLFEYGISVLDDGVAHLHNSMDALIVDAASGQIVGRELMQLYADPDASLPAVGITFRDYVVAEHALRQGAAWQRALAYWHKRIAELAPAPDLPLVCQPESIEKPQFTRRDRILSPAHWSALQAQARAHSVTSSIMLLAAFARVLGLWCRQPRFSLTLPLFNRLPLHPDINGVIGDFTSVVLLEVRLEANQTFAELARQLQEQLWQDMDHSAISGVQVLRERARQLGVQQSAMPIVFNSTLTEFVPTGEEDRGLYDLLDAEPVFSITQTPQVWLDHTLAEYDGQLHYNWDSIDALFPPDMMAEVFQCYGDLLERLVQAETWTCSSERLLPRAAVPAGELVLTPDHDLLMHQLFDRQASLTPDNVAVLAPERQLRYGELQAAARRMGATLQAQGIGPNQLVAVLMERGWEQVVATLAIQYAGGAYLPLDPALPQERIEHILQQAEVRIVLTQSRVQTALPEGLQRMVVDQVYDARPGAALPAIQTRQTDLAYVIYTSGSTGLPKGVMIDHRGAVNTLIDINQRFAVTAQDRVLAISSLSFDLSVYDIFGSLAVGAAVVILEHERARDPEHWQALLLAHQVSIWNSVPALLGMMVEYAESQQQRLPACLRLAMLSGDWIPLNLPPRFKACCPEAVLHSLGGATEASIWSIGYPIEAVQPGWRSVPYGKALDNQAFYVLNSQLEHCPTWVTGQLYIGGIGLAQGYWRDSERTSKSFFTHERSGLRLYRTGDLGRYLPDGNIEFLGREDGQVKIQGYRVELGEIETVLESHTSVFSAAVKVVTTARGEKRLAAYVVTAAAEQNAAALRSFLQGKLPAYMVPTSFTFLERMPLSSNGKVDKGQLPEPAEQHEEAVVISLPDDPALLQLIRVVGKTLQRDNIPLEANLLNLGASSIDIVRISNALHAELGFRPKLAQFMASPTLNDLLALYREHQPQPVVSAPMVSSEPSATLETIEDPDARQAFKAREPGRRRFATGVAEVRGDQADDAWFEQQFDQLRSVRQFSEDVLPVAKLFGMLRWLARRERNGYPKYLYASAGGLYPVQTYLFIKPGRVDGVEGGAYCYDPVQHRLVRTSPEIINLADAYDYFVNRPMFESAAFSLFLIADLAAIQPLYGEMSMDFCRIEAGAMSQLLTMAAADLQLGLCGVGSIDDEMLARLFQLSPHHQLVYSMVGGIKRVQETTQAVLEQFAPPVVQDDDSEMEEIEL